MTDAEATQLLERVMDRLDGILFKCGFVFRDEMDWKVASEEIMTWIYKYYDDEDPDNSYQPGDSELDEEEDEDEGSETLGSDTDEDVSQGEQKKSRSE